MKLRFGQFVIEKRDGRVSISFSWDWLRRLADQPANTGARHLFHAFSDMERTGASERILRPQDFSRMVGALTEAQPAPAEADK